MRIRCLFPDQHFTLYFNIHIKMADARELVVSEALCFLFNKFGKVPEKNIKSVVINFYNDEEVSSAKDLLYRRLEQLKIDGLPRLVKRKGDNKVKMDVEDIFTLLNFADEKLELSNLPTFVAVNVDRVPSIKPEDMDVFILAQKIAAIEEQLKLQAIAADEATRRADVRVTDKFISKLPTSVLDKHEEVPVNTSAVSGGAASTAQLDKNAAYNSSQTPESKVYQTKDNGSWVTVVKKRSAPAQPQRRIVGTGGAKAAHIKSTEKDSKSWHLFVGRLAPDTTEENLKRHLEENGISVASCRMLERKEKWQEKHAAFKVVIHYDLVNAAFDEDLWPSGAEVRDWYFSRRTVNTN